jgi:hypothetical protein
MLQEFVKVFQEVRDSETTFKSVFSSLTYSGEPRLQMEM